MKKEKIYWKIYTDGACRGNPGLSGAGIYLENLTGKKISKCFYLGEKTNNQAEYLALALAIFLLKSEMVSKPDQELKITIISDSELLVRQIKGLYKVRDLTLKCLKNLIFYLLEGVVFEVKHVLRENNKKADALANKAIDEKKEKIPLKFVMLLKRFNLTF
ncbi:TPA: ribonuclease H [Candidatus Dependentiae bacterium]|nr:ribonuclease H [Candidatus Dependentiae bacterium]HBZ73166.1 ribonuclease H [Candidatus Dependentiae bacterium]